MKKFLILLCMTLFLVACGNSEEKSSSEPVKNKVEDSEEANQELSKKEEKTKPEDSNVTPLIKLGEAVVVDDFAEFLLKSNTFTREVHPSNDVNYGFELENSQEILMHTIISLKNLTTTSKRADLFISEFKYIYDNKYEYVPEIVIEVNNGKIFDIAPNHEIAPLKTITLHCAGFLPSEVENDGKPLKAVITVNGEKFEQIIR